MIECASWLRVPERTDISRYLAVDLGQAPADDELSVYHVSVGAKGWGEIAYGSLKTKIKSLVSRELWFCPFDVRNLLQREPSISQSQN